LSVGAFATIWLLQFFGVLARLGVAALGSLAVSAVALGASTLHLGRPIYAYRALRMWKRSWLSREVLLFSAFSGVAGLYAAALWFGLPGSLALGAMTLLLGVAGVTASGCIYRVPARPAWNSVFTVVQFNFTAAVLGPLFAAAIGAGDSRWLSIAAALVGGGLALLLALRFLRLIAAESIELRGTARLLSTVLASRFVLRGGLLVAGAIALPLFAAGLFVAAGPKDPPYMIVALLLAVAGEILGRYLFFVSVVPRHMATPYIPAGSEAA
jgi:DMSO reductase anchor subunit